MKYFLTAILVCVSLCSQIIGQDRDAYIERYKDIAMVEMARTGIPASIKLAQAILESNAGESELARKSNNHFGIKCGSTWNGKTHMRKDDDRNRHGKLVKSCFRVFGSPEESFVAHSDFLADPGKSSRYGFLFDIEPHDYKAWAYGLKKAGYATNPQYPKLLLRLIDQYDLSQYDLPEPELLALQSGNNREDNMDDAIAEADRKAGRYTKRIMPVRFNNHVKFVFAQEGDRVADIALATETSAARIIRYNEHLNSEAQELEADSRVYLQKKRKQYNGTQKFHIVRQDQDMIDIAQLYGMRLDHLYKRNAMPHGSQPAIGEKLYLRGTRRNRPALRIEKVREEVPAPSDEIFLPPITAGEAETGPVSRTDTKQDETPAMRASFEPGYIVQKGDTLYQISRTHGIHIDDLRKINNLEGDTIHPGQKIKLSE